MVAAASKEGVELSRHFSEFGDDVGFRSVVVVKLDRVQHSCGYSMPYFTCSGKREQLAKFAQSKGEKGMNEYRRLKNTFSIDGLPSYGTIEDGGKYEVVADPVAVRKGGFWFCHDRADAPQGQVNLTTRDIVIDANELGNYRGYVPSKQVPFKRESKFGVDHVCCFALGIGLCMLINSVVQKVS